MTSHTKMLSCGGRRGMKQFVVDGPGNVVDELARLWIFSGVEEIELEVERVEELEVIESGCVDAVVDNVDLVDETAEGIVVVLGVGELLRVLVEPVEELATIELDRADADAEEVDVGTAKVVPVDDVRGREVVDVGVVIDNVVVASDRATLAVSPLLRLLAPPAVGYDVVVTLFQSISAAADFVRPPGETLLGISITY